MSGGGFGQRVVLPGGVPLPQHPASKRVIDDDDDYGALWFVFVGFRLHKHISSSSDAMVPACNVARADMIEHPAGMAPNQRPGITDRLSRMHFFARK